MEGCPGAAGAVGLGVDFLTAKIVGEVDAVEADPVKGAGVELDWGSGYGLAHGFLAALGDRRFYGVNDWQ
jgi:hypothetical protein